MIPYERQQRILELLENRELLRIDELCELIPEVSSSTIRRDIKELERAGKVEHLQGGAIKAAGFASETPTSVKASLHTREKEAIAERAAAEVADGDSIYVDSGTTCTALLAHLLERDIDIVTSNTDVVRLASSPIRAHIVLLGGDFNPDISSLSGPLTEVGISRCVFSKAFLGANGIDTQFGITTPSLMESNKKQAVATRSQQTFVLADSSKFHQVSAVQTLDLSQVTIISDAWDDEIGALTTLVTSGS